MCTAASYKSKESANELVRGLRRQRHLDIKVSLCEQCDSYHLKADATRLNVPPKGLMTVRLAAMGYNYSEISKDTGIPAWTLSWYVAEFKRSFGAMSLAHLVAIFICLGLLDPNDFVPQVTKREACL